MGRIYLQAVLHIYGNFAFGKLYTSKKQEIATDMLCDRVLPFYQEKVISIERILTENGTQYTEMVQ